jgi:hypothetical protein
MKYLRCIFLFSISMFVLISCIEEEINEQAEKLVEQLGSDDVQERKTAHESLETMDKLAIPTLLKYTKDKNIERKQNVDQLLRKYITKVGNFDDNERVQAMDDFIAINEEKNLELLKDYAIDPSGDFGLRFASAFALFKNDQEKTTKLLLPIYLEDPDESFPIAAVLEQKAANSEISKVLFNNDETHNTRVYAAHLISSRKSEESLEYLINSLVKVRPEDGKLQMNDSGKMIVLKALKHQLSTWQTSLDWTKKEAKIDEANKFINQIIVGLEKFLETTPSEELAEKGKEIIESMNK